MFALVLFYTLLYIALCVGSVYAMYLTLVEAFNKELDKEEEYMVTKEDDEEC